MAYGLLSYLTVQPSPQDYRGGNMLTEFQLTNFKAFAGPETIPIRPLTLIFGPNSSGKSSIFQCLLMLKQTIESSNTKTNLLIKGDLVDLGSYREFIHLHEIEKPFSVKIMIPAHLAMDRIPWDDVDWFETDIRDDIIYPLIKKYNVLGLSIDFQYDGSKKNTIVSRIELFAGDEPAYLLGYDEHPDDESFFTLSDVNIWHPKEPTDLADLIEHIDDYEDADIGKPNETQSLLSNEEELLKEDQIEEKITRDIRLNRFLPYFPGGLHRVVWNEVRQWDRFPEGIELLTPCTALGLEEALSRIIYIGPMREYPERYFSFSGNQTDYVGKSGKFVPDILISDPELLSRVNKWFDRDHLQVGYELKVFPLTDSAAQIHDLFALRLVDEAGVNVGLTDVGFGISQVLPVIIQTLISKGKTILIEQPEYHLHPRLQAELGDMFIEAALGESRNTFLIETHSEHLILRILRRIRETAEGTLPEGLRPIKPEDVAVVYVQPGDKGSRIISIPVNEEGYFDRPWPEGFFAERARELL